MPRGHIDSLTTSGLVEGWALDDSRPLTPLAVAILDRSGAEIASGDAAVWREDLAQASHGYGWCAFRLALGAPPEAVSGQVLRLVAVETRAVLFEGAAALRNDGLHEIDDLDALIATDPTLSPSIERLESLASVLDAFLVTQGVEAFVGAAYLYVLGRRVDPSGLASFSDRLRTRCLSPYGMLLSLAEGPEFVARNCRLVPPNRPGFPFLAA